MASFLKSDDALTGGTGDDTLKNVKQLCCSAIAEGKPSPTNLDCTQYEQNPEELCDMLMGRHGDDTIHA